MEPATTRGVDPDELQNLVDLAKAGNYDASQELITLFGEASGNAFRRHALSRLARALPGADSFYTDFEKLSEELQEGSETVAERLLAEGAAFAYVHNQITLAGSHDLRAAMQDPGSTVDRHDHRDQCLNAARATLSFVRVVRELENSPLRHARARVLEEQALLLADRRKLVQEQLRVLQERNDLAADEGSLPDTEQRAIEQEIERRERFTHMPELMFPGPDMAPEYIQQYGFESFQQYAVSLSPEELARRHALLLTADRHRGDWANPAVLAKNRWPTPESLLGNPNASLPIPPEPRDPKPVPRYDPVPRAPSPEPRSPMYYTSEKPAIPPIVEPVPVDKFTRTLLRELHETCSQPPAPHKR